METYRNVLFNRHELQLIDAAALHLGVAFPDVRKAPVKGAPRTPDIEARVVFHLVRDRTVGSHENVAKALAAVEHLTSVLERESTLDYWLETTERDTGTRPEPDQTPTSSYQVLTMLANVRSGQLADARKALDLLRDAHATTTPSREVTEENDHG